MILTTANQGRLGERTAASVRGMPPESAGFFGPIGSASDALDVRDDVPPTALFAIAALATLLVTMYLAVAGGTNSTTNAAP